MSCNSRRASVVLLALLVAVSTVCLDSGRAQVKIAVPAQPAPAGGPMTVPAPADPGANPDGFLNSGISLPKDEKGRKKAIEAARDYIEDKNWPIAIERLQKLVEIDEDVFVRLTRTNAEGKEVLAWVSVKQEADRLIGSLPTEGMDFYKATYGARAADMLKKARQTGDPSLLADVMKKYAHTDAGGEAIKLLADYHLDRGNYIAAVLCYSKLFNRQGADKLPPEVRAKAYVAAQMAPASGSTSSTALSGFTISAKELAKQLRETREFRFGEQSVSLEDLEEYIAKLERPNFNQNATDAVVFRSTPNRGNQLVGGPAFMSAKWRRRLFKSDRDYDGPFEKMSDEEKHSAAYAKLDQAQKALANSNQPIIPAFTPITITVSNGDKKTPLLIYKNYWGIVARNLKNGQLMWASPSSWSLEKMLGHSSDTRKSAAMNEWLSFYVNQTQHPQILFENSTVGTLSTDGQFVYVVEDLAVPPPPNVMNVNMGIPGGGMGGNVANVGADVQDAIQHSRLQAFELKTNGKLSWELGTPEEKGPLSDCYFLGPPLPLGGKLYVLTEKQQELRLVCIDPTAKGKVVSTQTLGSSQEKMQNDVLRRTTAAHLAYGEGILVCPTNAGAVFGINLLENSLVWAYPYRDKGDAPDPNQAGMMMGRMRGLPPGMAIGPNGQLIQTHPQHNQWKSSAPVISDGKVVFTAPDARSLHCINLRDGSPVWRKPKLEDDLYLGNVFNGTVLVVSKKSVRGLSLSTGEILWTLDTGGPSGQGIGSDNVYYLPLKEYGKDKEPHIVAIDLERGKIIGGSKSRPRDPGEKQLDVAGNLLFYEGDVVSLTPEEVVVYPQLKVKIAQMDELIAKNPNDPVGLTERGELRLDKNDLAGAIDDLTTALKNNPDKATRERARAKLYDTLTAYISDHFNDAEKYLDDYEKLCRVDMTDAKGHQLEELQAEQRRRRATYLWLVGKGREEQGRLVEAFEKYQQFADEAGRQSDLVPAVDERQVKAAPDVWSRGRIIAMMAKARPEQRAPLEKLIADKWDKLRQTNDLQELRRFARMFGSVSAAGKEARLQLVDRLMEEKDTSEDHPLLEAELELNQFRTGKHSPELAARATEALARLYTRKGLLEDAAYCYRKLGTEFAKTSVRDGKSGRDFYDDTATDKRLLPYLDEPGSLGSVPLRAKKETDNYRPQWPGMGKLFQFDHSGEELPFFKTHIVGLHFDNHEFKLLDRTSEDDNHAPREVWSQKLTPTMFQVLANQVLGNQNNNINPGMVVNTTPNYNARFPYCTTGHLVVLPLAQMVFGIDPVNRRVLWEKNVAAGGSGPEAANPQYPNGPQWDGVPAVDPRDGSILVAYRNSNWAQRLGQTSPLEGQIICVQFRDQLSALDPLTGRILWTRADVNPRNYLFADEDHVFLIELDPQSNVPHATRVFRATDGISVKAPDFSALFAKRLQILGRNLLLSETDASNKLTLRLYDVLTGQDVWKQVYPPRSLVARSEDKSMTAVVEPDGKVHVLDLSARKEVMSGQMADAAEHLRNVQTIHLLADAKYFYLACQAPMAANNNANRVGNAAGGVQSNVMTQLGMRTLPVNGYLHAFERDGGELAWHAFAKNQFLLLDQFEDLPVVLLTARQQNLQNLAPGRAQWAFSVAVVGIEKRSGKTLVGDEDLRNTSNFFGVHHDARTSTIDFLSPNLKISFTPKLNDEKNGKAAESGDKPASETRTPQTRQTIPAQKQLTRPVLERARIREIADPLPPR
jgi:outer membrane protein assembly factor BamB/tetratricopeptide (TPR) repeat protein